MAIDLETAADDRVDLLPNHKTRPETSVWNVIKRTLDPLASLRLTVVLFGFSIALILAGTFAQVDKDIWEVIGQYFRCWVAWISFPIFFPPSFVPEMPANPNEVTSFGRMCISIMQGLKSLAETCGGIWFPGGKLIGLLLAANLLSAHFVRFKAVATGTRLLAGLGAIAVGCGVTWFIISAAGNSQSFQNEPWVPYPTLWIGFEGLLALSCVAAVYATVTLAMNVSGRPRNPRRTFVLGLMGTLAFGFSLGLIWLIMSGEAARPTDASLRILWQLTQGGVASISLLAGCFVVFGKRAGIVLLHSGIGLMMFYELHVALTAVETQMNLEEGETTNYVSDIRTFELAVIDKPSADQEHVTAIPRSMVVAGKTIDLPDDIPFRIQILQFIPNTHLRRLNPDDRLVATAGLGTEIFVESTKPGSGTDMESKVDMPAAYVSLTDRKTDKPIGTYLVSMSLWSRGRTDKIQVGDKTYELALRPKRHYKSYHFRLKDVRAENYIGTNTARHYASTVTIDDPDRGVKDQEKTIWMNNPLRFADETFYQSRYDRDQSGNEFTVLSVVANSGWMMPYVACMLVAIGMLSHFLMMLVRFLMQSDSVESSVHATRLAERLGIKPVAKAMQNATVDLSTQGAHGSTIAVAAVLLGAAAYITAAAIPPAHKDLDYDLYEFGQIPVVQGGRVKPLDSAARSALLTISGRTFVEVGHDKDKRKVPAIQWMLDVIAGTEMAGEYEVFKVENLEVQELIGVKKREGMRYSVKEIGKNERKFHEQVLEAGKIAQVDRHQLNTFQRKLLELHSKILTFQSVNGSFFAHRKVQYDTPPVSPPGTGRLEKIFNNIRGKTREEKAAYIMDAIDMERGIRKHGEAVLAIPPTQDDEEWQTLAGGWVQGLMESLQGKEESNPAVTAWDSILLTYEQSKHSDVADADDKLRGSRPQDFNRAVGAYLSQLKSHPPKNVKLFATQFEAFFNHFQPFTHADRLYVVAFVLGACGWLGWTRGFNRATFWLLVCVFVLHTLALGSRIYISGRPPVTNLYSSAVFIGWGCVALGLVLELVYRLGIGNLIASVAGYATLLIADGLSLQGDTFTVLQAVLDTQFWLATHVTTITLGYATTYLAGLLGLVYVLRGVFTPSLTPEIGRDLYRMIYGTLCFSIFFSFVGTVLGGLWADDSWGRFWGWDPKENGALIIVLWNALVLHARWGGLVKERGMAVLAIAGNIFVSWSWWGVNELGAGLHSYGFTEGTVIKLGLFVLSQLVLIGIGMAPKKYWRSFRERATA